MKYLALPLLFLMSILVILPAYASADNNKLKREITRLEGEIDSLEAQIQKKQETQFHLEDQRGSSSLNQEEKIDLENKIERVKSDILLLQNDLEKRKNELAKAREELVPGEPAGHYHPRSKKAPMKYPFRTNPKQ